jgi:hypothetical protein
MVTDSVIQEATRRLVDNFHPVMVLVSDLWAKSGEDSEDLDVVVVCHVDEQTNRNALAADMHRALRGVPLGCLIYVFTPEEFELHRQIVGTVARDAWVEGKVTYGAAV